VTARIRVYIIALAYSFLAGCSQHALIDSSELYGSWEYDVSKTMRSFLLTSEQFGPLISVDERKRWADAVLLQQQKSGYERRLTIDGERIRSESPFRSQTYTYRVVKREGDTYALELTNEAGSTRLARIRAGTGELAVESPTCEEFPEGCAAVRKMLRDRYGIELPALPAYSDKGRSACSESAQQSCGLTIDPKKIFPRWLYYAQADDVAARA